ncbi:YtxH domain-containing protein [Gracilibacillus saliphilus]|uniref:YtxH domain-containing protein n=1 Tax=Gracilibacillus saliphilus TaxID=543890 RepID=UPI0013D46161|nr:YtxH domain-containing protein [Gracilibacillus saliphilus]
MGKERLLKGILAGAIVGGLITLSDRETRSYVTRKLQVCGNKTSYYAKNPADAIHQLNSNYARWSEQLATGLTSALNMLHQLQELTEKIDKRDDNG